MAQTPEVKIRIDGDDAGAVAALQRVDRAGRGVESSLGRAGVSASGAANNIGKLRGPLTSVAQGFLQLNPGVASFVSVLGMLTLSGGVMVGVLAGATALSFAWKQLTKDTKEAKGAAEEYANTMRSLRMAQGGPAVGLGAPLGRNLTRVDEIDRELAELDQRKSPAPWTLNRRWRLRNERAGLVGEQSFLQGRHSDIRLDGVKPLQLASGPVSVTVKSAATRQREAEQAEEAAEQRRIGRMRLDEFERTNRIFRINGVSVNDRTIVGANNPRGMTAPVRGGGISFNRDGALSAGAGFLTSMASGGGTRQSLLGLGSGLAASVGGPLGVGLGAAVGIIGGLLGKSKDREEEQYRAHLRALRDARQELFNFTIVIPKGVPNPRDPEWKQWLTDAMVESSGTRTGRVTFVEA
jgi:hypothetical protein